MRFLVTGGAGFIGSAFIRNLLNDNLNTRPESIIVLDSLTYAGTLRNLESVRNDTRLRFIKGDIGNKELVNSLVKLSDIVINFAAETHVDRSIKSSELFWKTNILGTAILSQACIDAGGKKFIQVSTDEVYGSIDSGAWDETSILEPNSPYAASKAAAEMLLRGLGKTHGLDYRITRCSNNYGIYQNPEKVIPHFIWRIIQGLDLPIYGNGQNRREWIHVDDHCVALELVAISGKSQTIYNIGGGFELTNIALAEKLIQISGTSKSKVSFVEDRKNHDYRYSINDARIRNELGFTPQKEFETELKKIFDWYTMNQDWLKASHSREKTLPS